ncbi:protease pro-enzyme activation domain-containing protein, partial [Streptomyces puniciscabiei]|uniref:protease pro-enzyme activation domain-containing protein n=1 Tax=Streptomyces puniciscabiei TaxID=164348 RepID=UPI003331D60A
MLRRRAEMPEALVAGSETISSEHLAKRYGADPADVELVIDIIRRYGLTVNYVDRASRRIEAIGTSSALGTLFGAQLSLASSPHPVDGAPIEHRHREGSLHVPAELDGVVQAVLGLDDRPQARPHLRYPSPAPGATAFTPTQIGQMYDFPDGVDGSGHTLAIIELGGGFFSDRL